MTHDQLSFEHWRMFYAKLHYGDSSAEIETEYLLQQAHQSHALQVFNPLRDLIEESVFCILPVLENESAQFYMRFGAGRRYPMIWKAYREIIFTAEADREEPLNSDETADLTQALNVLYVNLRGVLDNLAWAVAYEKSPDLDIDINDPKNRGKIGLFTKLFKRTNSLKTLNNELAKYEDWYNTVAEKRDPSAHRIPLAIPPAIVTKNEGDRWNELYSAAINSAALLDFDNSEAAYHQMDQLGRFDPVFVHHPSEGKIPLYPTIPDDMAHLIRITEVVFQFLLNDNSYRVVKFD